MPKPISSTVGAVRSKICGEVEWCGPQTGRRSAAAVSSNARRCPCVSMTTPQREAADMAVREDRASSRRSDRSRQARERVLTRRVSTARSRPRPATMASRCRAVSACGRRRIGLAAGFDRLFHRAAPSGPGPAPARRRYSSARRHSRVPSRSRHHSRCRRRHRRCTGTVHASRISCMFHGFRMPMPEPISEASGITATQPIDSSTAPGSGRRCSRP